jgi:hypothetical protein
LDGAAVRIGHFPGFKGYDAVLISCDHGDVDALRNVAREVATSRTAVLVNARCLISETKPADLRLFAAPPGIRIPPAASHFVWRIDGSLHSSLDGLLEGLVGPAGHQYFDLDGENAILVVSVGEYDDNWWRAQAELKI